MRRDAGRTGSRKVLMTASVASMIDQFNMPNIRLLQEMGYEVHVACNFKTGNTCSAEHIRRFRQTLESMRVRLHQWDCPRKLHAASVFYRAYMQLLKLTRKYSFDWIHCHSPAGGVLSRLAAHRRRIPIVYTVHGFHFYQGAPLKNWILYYPVEKLLSYWTDLLITLNREDYRLAQNAMQAGRISYIPGVGIDVRHFCKYSARDGDMRHERLMFWQKYQIPEDAFVLLSVGELSSRKNHREVITAIAGMRRRNVYYVICGQGEQKQGLMRLAVKLGVRQRVRLAGFQENVEEFYRYSDVFVFPSVQEGMPVSLMEAMASGMPCVVSDIRGNRELIDSNGGILFSLGKPQLLSKELDRLLDHTERMYAYAEHNRKKAEKFDQAVIQKKMLQIYRNLEQMCGKE